MDRKKSVIRAGAVLAVALAAGHFVQTMNDGKTAPGGTIRQGSVEQVSAGAEAAPAVTPTPKAAPAEAAPVLASLPEAAATLPPPARDSGLGDPLLTPPLATAPAAKPATEAPAPAATPVADCSVDLGLKAAARAMIAVRLSAPCNGGQRVVLRHAGLTVAEEIPASGVLELDLPALKADGEVSALFADASVARGAVPVPDADAVHRFAVQWMADDAFQVHALENGADYGQPGHVWTEAPVSANGGYVIALGNPTLDLPMMAEVYTWPADATIAADVSVEAVVTDATCGRELLGETIAARAGAVTVTDLTLAMPDCDALGDILVLKNPGQDVTLAATN